MTLRHAWPVAFVRTVIVTIIFFGAILSAFYTQIMANLFFRDLAHLPQYLQAVINLTKDYFVIIMIFLTRLIAPSKVLITWNSTENKDLFNVDQNDNLISNLAPNSVLISNHQIYTDWLYLWWISYTANLSRSVYIILKDMSKIPILGYGMKNYKFLFLTRKWVNDKFTITSQLNEIDANARGMGPVNGVKQVASENATSIKWPQGTTDQKWPFQLIIFPEGTVTSDRTTKKSAQFCLDKNIPKLNHVLLPRTRGLFLALRKLRNTVEVVYDFTTGYGNLKPEEYGEIKFSLKRHFFLGYGPPTINYYVREFKIKDIPLGVETEDIDEADPADLLAFESWLNDVWYEKDKQLAYFYKTGTFNNVNKINQETIIADLKLRNWYEIFIPFIPTITTFLVLRLIYVFVLSVLK